jgi:acid phosphatase|tara:strand:+ start:3223 stop:4038 length:816 start_codon:yes stop_codon:yes gene_type:complete
MRLALFIFLLSTTSVHANDEEHQGILATLYVQNSAEFDANSINVYKSAIDKLPKLLATKNISAAIEQHNDFNGKPPAVILDVDQTVLNNVAYQARLIENRTYYPEGWDEWCMEEKADYLPGVEDFLDYATDLGIEIFFVTNRTANLEKATRNNLEKLGFKFAKNKDQLLMKGERPDWTSNKTSRRSLIAEKYRILMILGDNLGDFVDSSENITSPKNRRAVAEKYRNMWGEYWFMLSNPNYGDWENAIIDFNFGLPKDQQLQRKLDALDPK